jgi:hypothetical protein
MIGVQLRLHVSESFGSIGEHLRVVTIAGFTNGPK